MNITLYQIVLALVSFGIIFERLIKFFRKEKSQSFFKLATTIIVWVSILVLTLHPQLARTISLFLGLGENLNTLIFIGFIAVFLIIFKLLGIIENLESNITEIIRREALKDIISGKK